MPTFNLEMIDFFLMDHEFEFLAFNVSQFYINIYLLINAYVNLLYISQGTYYIILT